MPETLAQACFERAAERAYRRNGPGVERLRANMGVAAPKDDLTLEALRSYYRYWCEVLSLETWTTAELIARTKTSGEEILRRAHAGPGAIVALPHMGNWDWAGAWAAVTGMPVLAVAERLRPACLHNQFTALRRSIGIEVVSSDGTDTMPRLIAAVEQKRLVTLVCDRQPSGVGVDVTLLGRITSVPVGPAHLARRTGAKLIPTTMAYQGRDLLLTFHPPVAPDTVRAMMQGVSDAFSAGIAAAPQDWHMMQDMFVR